jgi:uncharacterized protein (DUF433 family)
MPNENAKHQRNSEDRKQLSDRIDIGQMTTTSAPYELIARWIQPGPRRPGPAEAWVLPLGVPVWVLVGRLQLEEWNLERIATDHRLPLEAVRAAVAYYQRHQAAIDEQIERNRTYYAVPHPR